MNCLRRPSSSIESLLDEREATRRKLTMPLLDDGTHNRWVNAVFQFCRKERTSTQEMTFFLVAIISESEGRLNPKIWVQKPWSCSKSIPS